MKAYDTGLKTKSGKMQYYIDLQDNSILLNDTMNCPKRLIGHYGIRVKPNMKINPYPPYDSLIDGEPYLTNSIEIPCGKCLGCQMDKAQEWATRIYNEALQHQLYYFTTLTYNDQHYYKGRDFKRDLQLFLKRLRKNTGEKIRYFAQFEHGEHTGRGHFHLIIFFDKEPKDKYKFIKKNANHDYYSSEQIQKAWQLGNDITIKSEEPTEAINYVSRYCVKKTGEDGFHLQSRNPGIGDIDLTKKDYVLIHMKNQTHKTKIPKFNKEKMTEEDQQRIKEKSRIWIATKYFEPKPENEKNITGKEELNAEKTRNLIAKNSTKLNRKI